MDKARSPYQRHGKTPFRYSDLFHRWRVALIEGRADEARRLGAEHDARYLSNRGFRNEVDEAARSGETDRAEAA